MNQYGNPQYWEERYTREQDQFDWYQRFSGIRDQVLSHINPETKILNVGSGSSRLSEEMFDEGYQNITNIDFSMVVTKQMQERYKDQGPNFKYIQMDVRNMEFDSKSFDCVIDKGLLDSVLCGESQTTNANKMLQEIHRVLTEKGVYIVLTHGTSEFRKPVLQKPEFQWDIQEFKIIKPQISDNPGKEFLDKYQLYICKKNEGNIVEKQE
ncbi:protein kinase domain protein [Ichthyophthirius multifiliis]|uniref:Protein kinase domain protein n=1 Tax=Ichthyophthirius multifiliis TaxID=5932 RepID=G0QYY5_ICHMU|nr:protein kinase domain protein [Ichthyophthirius multifiliis]EGR29556.1 protein kinase domain protein [Ichthyophthirius multifiliis]|eukprot:XP_004030792.1 protein kinase domain protein [Ichthyophthirius multifiliis]